MKKRTSEILNGGPHESWILPRGYLCSVRWCPSKISKELHAAKVAKVAELLTQFSQPKNRHDTCGLNIFGLWKTMGFLCSHLFLFFEQKKTCGWDKLPMKLPSANLTWLLKMAIYSEFSHDKLWFSMIFHSFCMFTRRYQVTIFWGTDIHSPAMTWAWLIATWHIWIRMRTRRLPSHAWWWPCPLLGRS